MTTEMSPTELVLTKLNKVTESGDGWMACCPAHGENNPSMSVKEGDDGRVLTKCYSKGCDFEDIMEAIGLKPSDGFIKDGDYQPLSPEEREAKQEEKRQGKRYDSHHGVQAYYDRSIGCSPSKIWTYYDANGDAVGKTYRYDPPGLDKDDNPRKKETRPAMFSKVIGEQGWYAQAMKNPRPVYNLREIKGANSVIVCEGEKATEAAHKQLNNIPAICSWGGSGAAHQTDWSPLEDKTVYILPDNDVPGEKYANDVAKLARACGAKSINIVRLPGLPDGGDIADWEGTDAELLQAFRDAEIWEPEPPEETVEEYQPFPTDALPSPSREFVEEGAAAIGCDASYLALPVLSVLGSTIGTTMRLRLKRGWDVPAIIWTCIVGESGSQKTPPWRAAVKPLQERQNKLLEVQAAAEIAHENALEQYTRAMKRWKHSKTPGEHPPEKPTLPDAERLMVSDSTIEAMAPILLANPRGVLLARDELSGWLGSFDRYSSGKGGDVGHWLSAYSGESMTVDRKHGTPKTINVPQAAVSIAGGIQPGILQQAMGKENRDNGLMARFLFASPPRRPKVWTEHEISSETEAAYAAVIDRMLMVSQHGGNPITLADDAKAVWIDYYNAHNDALAAAQGDKAASYSKLEEIPARLALVLHCAMPGFESRISAETMMDAIRLAEWFRSESDRLYGLLDESPKDRNRRELVSWIRLEKGGEATTRDVMRKWRTRYKSSGEAEAALQALAEVGYGTATLTKPGPTGGAAKRVFRLHA